MKKRIFIDLDGVCADFEAALYNKFPELLSIPKGTTEHGEMVDFLCQNKGRDIFRHLNPITGAIEAFNFLNKHYEVYFLSTPMWDLPESYQHKREWVEHHFGEVAYKKLILSHNKGILSGHYLIDDRIKHGVDKFEGEHIHFGQEKFSNWGKVIEYLTLKDQLFLNAEI